MALTTSGRPGSDGNEQRFQHQNVLAQFLNLSTSDGMTALSGGGQSGATDLSNYSINRFTTVAADHDSAILPAAKRGRMRIVMAKGGHILDVYPLGTTDVINAIAAQNPYSIADTKVAIFFCAVDGTWDTLLTA